MAHLDHTPPAPEDVAARHPVRPAPRQWWAGSEERVPGGLDWLSGRERARLGLPGDSGSLAGIEVLNRVTGAPYVVVGGLEAACEISLSDRAGTAVAAVGSTQHELGALGIDLEVVEPRSAGFVADLLTPAEQAWVTGPAAGEGGLGRDAAANLVWSAKESALKVLRLGLRADTRWVHLLTVATEQPVDPPEAIAGAADLAVATPGHTWVARPVVTPTQ